MSYFLDHWSFDPFVVIALVTVAIHEIGQRRLAGRSTPAHTALRRRRSSRFVLGLGILLLAVSSPVDYWAGRYFFVHMIEHILIMFFAPMAVVGSAPWTALMHALPVGIRRRIGRAVILGGAWAPVRRLWHGVSSPWFALGAFNAVMLFWHLPGPFDLAERTAVVHIWCMHASFFLAGVLFWLQILPSRPFHRRATPMWQMGAILSSNVVMFFLAMALSIFSHHSWYGVYDHVRGVTMSPFADQQMGAAILWVCGDFWAIPALSYVVRQALSEHGGFSGMLDAAFGRAREAALFRMTGVSEADAADPAAVLGPQRFPGRGAPGGEPGR